MSLENRQNIVQLFFATLGRSTIASKVDSKTIWNKIGAIMTDSNYCFFVIYSTSTLLC